MAENGKARILFLAELLRRETDPEHPLSEKEISARLSEAGFAVERKTVYDDLRTLADSGMDIVSLRGKNGGYYLSSGTFELSELKLLVDAVQAAKFISRSRSDRLIGKLCSFSSVYLERSLDRQVYVWGRTKSDNPAVYYTVDTVFEAIDRQCRISFQYMEWTVAKALAPRRDSRYRVTPHAMMWDDENYYLIAYDHDSDSIRHYRVDKMRDALLLDEPAADRAVFDGVDPGAYSRQLFGMYRGSAEAVTLLCHRSLVGVIIDRFGDGVTLRSIHGGEEFLVTVKVMTSPVFFGWVAGFGSRMRIVEPAHVAGQMTELAREILNSYDIKKE